MYLLKLSGPQIWLYLFTFRPIASKQLNGFTRITTLSSLGGTVVTRGSFPGSDKGFKFDVLFYSCRVFSPFLSKNTLFVTKVCNSFYSVTLFSIKRYLTY